MNKLFTLILLIAFYVSANAQLEVAYVTKEKEMDTAAGAATIYDDAIIRMLEADENFNVDVLVCDGDGVELSTSNPISLEGYDVIVAQETFGSGDAIWQEGGALHIGQLPAPTLYNKIFALRKGKAFTESSASAIDAKGNRFMQISEGMEDHEIFTNIETDDDGIFQVMYDSVSDGGAIDTASATKAYKTLQYTYGNVISEAYALLAYPVGCDTATIAISDFPQYTDIDGTSFKSRVIAFNFNYGVLVANDAGNLTEAGMTLWTNAIYSLAGIEITSVKDKKYTYNNFDVNYYGNRLKVNLPYSQHTQVSLYSVTGKLIKSQDVYSETVFFDMTSGETGVYLVKVEGKKVNGIKKVVVY